MNVRIAALVLCVLLAAAAPAVAAAPAAPPDGTYTYRLESAGAAFGTTTLVLRREPGAIVIDETATVGPATASIHTRLDATTLTPVSYESSYAAGERATSRKIALDAAHAVVSGPGIEPRTIELADETKHFTVVDQAFVTGFAMLPAQLATWKEARLTGVLPLRGVGFSIGVGDDGAIARSADVPERAVALGLASPVAVREWYDPATMVLEVLDVPAQQLHVRLIARS